MENKITKIGLGAVQWGLDYGISNQNGQTPARAVKKILDFSQSCGINTIDTAPDYGESEQVIGSINTSSFRLCTKIPSLKGLSSKVDIDDLFRLSVRNSLEKLRTDKLEYLLLHDCNDLLGPYRDHVVSLMQELKRIGVVEKIGFSAYSSCQISFALSVFNPDVVQVPFSIFDQRLLLDGTLGRLKNLDIEIHARSVFLQGLLLMEPAKIDKYFDSFMPFVFLWHETCAALRLSPLDLAIYFAVCQPFIDKAIIGISNVDQLKEIVSSVAADRSTLSTMTFSELAHTSDYLLNPSLWSFKS